MSSLTGSEIAQIARLQREAGLQRLSSHFSWPEYQDERRGFHQEFVYAVAMFAAASGFPWRDVIQAAVMAKDVFPRLDGCDLSKLLILLRDALLQCLPNLTRVHQHALTKFLIHTCTSRQRLFQAVVGGDADVSITRLHLEVQLPPATSPLAQGIDLQEWERRQHQAELTSMLQQKEEKLRMLREGSRVSLGEVNVPEDEQLDKEDVLMLVRAAVRATEGQMLESLTHEASLLSDIQRIKLQLAALATGRLHNPLSSPADLCNSSHPESRAFKN